MVHDNAINWDTATSCWMWNWMLWFLYWYKNHNTKILPAIIWYTYLLRTPLHTFIMCIFIYMCWPFPTKFSIGRKRFWHLNKLLFATRLESTKIEIVTLVFVRCHKRCNSNFAITDVASTCKHITSLMFSNGCLTCCIRNIHYKFFPTLHFKSAVLNVGTVDIPAYRMGMV